MDSVPDSAAGRGTCVFAKALQTLRLECGGIAALTMILGGERRDVHQMVGLAQERHGSLTNLPWVPMVQDMVRWTWPRRGQTRP